MEKTMMLPAMYNVLSQEEMTYTEGGATMTQALLAALLPPLRLVQGQHRDPGLPQEEPQHLAGHRSGCLCGRL